MHQISGGRWLAQHLASGRQHPESIANPFGQQGHSVAALL